jgi:hypothetical protein
MGGTGSLNVNVFKCCRNSADAGVQVLVGLGYAILGVRGAAKKAYNIAVEHV